MREGELVCFIVPHSNRTATNMPSVGRSPVPYMQQLRSALECNTDILTGHGQDIPEGMGPAENI